MTNFSETEKGKEFIENLMEKANFTSRNDFNFSEILGIKMCLEEAINKGFEQGKKERTHGEFASIRFNMKQEADRIRQDERQKVLEEVFGNKACNGYRHQWDWTFDKFPCVVCGKSFTEALAKGDEKK